MNVLFVASEIFPYAKSGGLADVAEALPDALKEAVCISRVMPLYGSMKSADLTYVRAFTITLAKIQYPIKLYSQRNGEMTTYFIEAPLLSTTKGLYGESGSDYSNNDLRFGIFCMAVVTLATQLKIDILHVNDWHSALIPFFVVQQELKIKTVLTIHNLAYQGIFPKKSLDRLGISQEFFTMDLFEFYGDVNFLKAGIAYSDIITTVSPSYAKEIITPEFGCGLDGFLSCHQDKIQGILNGINTTLFNPQSDPSLAHPFSADSLEGKYKNKSDFIKKSSLKDPRRPLFVMITRLVEQKGVDLLLEVLTAVLKKKINLFVVGEGSDSFASKLFDAAQQYDNFEFMHGYDEVLSHQAYAAADFLLMPSRFEPCGLNQMIAMRYGVIPIVSSVGGLRDTVFENEQRCGRGIVLHHYSAKALLMALQRGVKLKKESKTLQTLQQFNMQCDFSFSGSALKYLDIYKKLLL
jgi:starch synthase